MDNRLERDGTYSYLYDDEGNRTRRTRITTSEYVEYLWDHRNRLTEVLFKTSAGATTKKVRYTYDVLDRRVKKEIDATGDGAYEQVEKHAYDGSSLLAVLNGSEQNVAYYLHGPELDFVLAESTTTFGTSWLVHDHQRSVRGTYYGGFPDMGGGGALVGGEGGGAGGMLEGGGEVLSSGGGDPNFFATDYDAYGNVRRRRHPLRLHRPRARRGDGAHSLSEAVLRPEDRRVPEPRPDGLRRRGREPRPVRLQRPRQLHRPDGAGGAWARVRGGVRWLRRTHRLLDRRGR